MTLGPVPGDQLNEGVRPLRFSREVGGWCSTDDAIVRVQLSRRAESQLFAAVVARDPFVVQRRDGRV